MCIHFETCLWHDKNTQSNHRTDKYSQQSSIIWPVWLNGWVFVDEISGCGFKSRCSRLKFRYRACFEQWVPWHSGNYKVGFTMKDVREMIGTHSQMHGADKYSQQSSTICPVWLNGWVLVYKLCGCRFESRCSNSNLSLDIRVTTECGFYLKRVRDMIRTHIHVHCTDQYSQQS